MEICEKHVGVAVVWQPNAGNAQCPLCEAEKQLKQRSEPPVIVQLTKREAQHLAAGCLIDEKCAAGPSIKERIKQALRSLGYSDEKIDYQEL